MGNKQKYRMAMVELCVYLNMNFDCIDEVKFKYFVIFPKLMGIFPFVSAYDLCTFLRTIIIAAIFIICPIAGLGPSLITKS